MERMKSLVVDLLLDMVEEPDCPYHRCSQSPTAAATTQAAEPDHRPSPADEQQQQQTTPTRRTAASPRMLFVLCASASTETKQDHVAFDCEQTSSSSTSVGAQSASQSVPGTITADARPT